MKNRLKTLALTSCAVIALATAAHAQDTAKFDIAGGDLKTALQTFATQTSQEVLFSTDIVAGRRTKGVSAETDPQSALVALLDGTGLTYQRTPTGTLLVVRASDPQSGSAAGDGADSGTVQALIVTAQKREENIQDVPIAMSAFTQEDLTKSQVAGGPDLMTQVPNFTFTKTNFSGYSIQIRGIGTQAISATTDPAVAVAFNNTPFIRNRFFEQEFYDLQRVEVLRGPQGTLYGRNATAGVVNLISAKPTYEFAAKASGDIANYGTTRLEGMLNLPLVQDKVALRLAGEWTKRDGYVKNLLTGRQTDGRDLWSARATLKFEPTARFSANLIYEHFSENDDRLRSGKQLCDKDVAPAEINGVPITLNANPLDPQAAALFSQGCKPASLYSPDSYQTPDGYSLPYYGAAGALGSPVYIDKDPYLNARQSPNLREIETHLKPDYEASNDVVELQIKFDLSNELALESETGFSRDKIFSFEDYNRFDTTPGVFIPGATNSFPLNPRYDIVDQNGVFCDPQLGCTNRLALGDLSTAKSRQFSQEFRLSSEFEGPFNFSLGANFLKYDTEEKYYVFANSLTAYKAGYSDVWIPNVSDNGQRCWSEFANKFGDPSRYYAVDGCAFIDPNDVHHLNDQGRNYFLSKNPYHLLSYAAFGEAYYNITPSLKFTAGFRWTDDKKVAPQIPSWLLAADTYGTPTKKVYKHEWREPTGRVALDWQPTLSFTDQTLVYASYVRGYKAGGSNPPPPVLVVYGDSGDNAVLEKSGTRSENFDAEYVNAFEVGSKNTLGGGKITLNANAFYYDYMGYQISEIVDRAATNLNFNAKIWGAELELEWIPVENLHLGFKGGYERTRLAKGSTALDLIDRTAGNPDYIVKRPFPTLPSNCIVPVVDAFTTFCQGLTFNLLQPIGLGESSPGILKDLSGNELPNAPHFTATITTDYTIPLPADWLLMLHSDLYYQSEAWTRVFNMPGYDRLKAYENVNVAAIFSNEDRGWQVMAYVKNVLNKDNITGAFLNSDDTGLTTNVFLNEPRLYGLRVTKQFDGLGPLEGWFGRDHKAGEPYPLRLEVSGYHGAFSDAHTLVAPAPTSLYAPDLAFPFGPQRGIEGGNAGGARLTYAFNTEGWEASLAARYGHADGQESAYGSREVPGGCYEQLRPPLGILKYCIDNTTGVQTVDVPGRGTITLGGRAATFNDFYATTGKNREGHTVVEFTLAKNFSVEFWPDRPLYNKVSAGIRYGHLTSGSGVELHGRPDVYIPPDHGELILSHMHVFNTYATMDRAFEGLGPVVDWEAALPLFGEADKAGRIDLETELGGSFLYGTQEAHVHGDDAEFYQGGLSNGGSLGIFGGDLIPPTDTRLDYARKTSVHVPTVNASLGLSYTLGGTKISGGYRWERFINAIDGGIAERKTYDRTIDGPYVKVSIGFGG